jgi:hypothetical protein
LSYRKSEEEILGAVGVSPTGIGVDKRTPSFYAIFGGIDVLKKTCAATGLAVAAVANAPLLGSPAHAGGFGGDSDKNINSNSIDNANESTNTNSNTNTAAITSGLI